MIYTIITLRNHTSIRPAHSVLVHIFTVFGKASLLHYRDIQADKWQRY